jgi:hypothetical protein
MVVRKVRRVMRRERSLELERMAAGVGCRGKVGSGKAGNVTGKKGFNWTGGGKVVLLEWVVTGDSLGRAGLGSDLVED